MTSQIMDDVERNTSLSISCIQEAVIGLYHLSLTSNSSKHCHGEDSAFIHSTKESIEIKSQSTKADSRLSA